MKKKVDKTRDKLKAIKPKKYRIYGIFDLNKKKLVYVDLDKHEVFFYYEINDYTASRFEIVSFDVLLS